MKEYTFFISAEHCTNYSPSKIMISKIISIATENKRLSTVSRKVCEKFSRSLKDANCECVCITSFNLIGIEEVNEYQVKYDK